MKTRILALVAFSAIVAACSGGGGGGTVAPPTAGPTATPVPLAYAAKIVWAGAMHYATSAAALVRSQSIDSSSGAILMVSADSTDPTAQGGDPRGADIVAQVSPAPTSYPATTFTTTLSAVASVTATPTPTASASPQPPTVLLEPGHANASGTGTVTATISAPVSVATTAPVIVYPMLTLNCGRAVPTGEHIFGVQWSGTAWVDDADPTTADLYLGTNNAGCFPGDSSTSNTLYYPGGGVILDSTNAFDLIATTDWVNAGTSIDIGLTSNVMDKTIVFKTRGGVYAKYHPVAYGAYPDLGGAIEIHGQGLDSF